jgi:hypothetical protein
MEEHSCAQQFERLGKLRRLRKPTDFRDEVDRVEKAVGPRRARDQKSSDPRVE